MYKWQTAKHEQEHMFSLKGITCPWSRSRTWHLLMLQNDNGSSNVQNHYYRWQKFGKQNEQMFLTVTEIVVFTKPFYFISVLKIFKITTFLPHQGLVLKT